MVSKLQNFMVEKDVAVFFARSRDAAWETCKIPSPTWDPRVPIVAAVSADFSSIPARPRFEALLAQW